MISGYVIALVVFLAYIALIFALNRNKWLERHSMSLYGPFLMWRTRRGKALIDQVASKKRFWAGYGAAALWICLLSMAAMMLLLIWEATIVPQIKSPPSPQLVLGIPGINPIIPIGYGIVGLAIAIAVHEFAHGILSRAGDIKVRSLGLVFLVIPVGAFVEPDENDMKDAPRSKRAKVYAVGPATNIVLSLVILLLFSCLFMSSLEPTHEGALISVTTGGVVVGSPAARAGLTANCVVTSVGGTVISNTTDLDRRLSPSPGALVNVSYYLAGRPHSVQMVDGIVVAFTASGYAAANAGLRAGMVLVSLNNTLIRSDAILRDVMAGMHANQTLNVTVMSYDSFAKGFVVNSTITTVKLSDKYRYYEEFAPSRNSPSYRNVGYLGAGFSNLGIQVENASYYQQVLSNPFRGDRTFTDYSFSALRLIALPFLHLAPLRSPVIEIYHPAGALAWMPDGTFWILANALYWVFWLNLMVGLTNVLPAVPLDGGYLFRDFVEHLLSKTGKTYTKEQRDKVVGNVVLALALVVLGLILWQIVGPALRF